MVNFPMARWFLSFLVIALLALPLPLAADDCYCTGRDGEKIALGDTYCLTVNGREIMAQCVMSLNNTNWRHLHQGCAGLLS
ncbi:MAG: hypothetical protein AAGF94_19035 [Pseudomonadota bacterium]